MPWETITGWSVVGSLVLAIGTAWVSGRFKLRRDYLDMQTQMQKLVDETRTQMQGRIDDKDRQIVDLKEAVGEWRKTATEREEQVRILMSGRTQQPPPS